MSPAVEGVPYSSKRRCELAGGEGKSAPPGAASTGQQQQQQQQRTSAGAAGLHATLPSCVRSAHHEVPKLAVQVPKDLDRGPQAQHAGLPLEDALRLVAQLGDLQGHGQTDEESAGSARPLR